MTSFVWMGLGNLALATALAAAAWLSGRLLRRPAITHGLWVLVLLKLVTPPMGFVPVFRVASAPMAVAPAINVVDDRAAVESLAEPSLRPGVVEIPEELSDDFAAAEPREAEIPPVRGELPAPAAASPVAARTPALPESPAIESWAATVATWTFPAAAILWLGGAVALWLRTARTAWKFDRLVRHAADAPSEIAELAGCLAAEMSVPTPRVAMAESVLSPMLWVWGRTATLVLPRQLFERLSSEQQMMLLIHELAHWKRGDHWVRRLECLASGLYWWCPLIAWAQAELRQAEEECCDAWVVAMAPGSARSYALTLAMTVDFLSETRPETPIPLPPLASGLGSFFSLQRRLTMIFRTGIPRRLSLAGVLGLAALGGMLLTWSPGPTARAQDNPRPKKDGEGPPREGKRDGDPRPKKDGEGPPRDGKRDGDPRPKGDQRPDPRPEAGPDGGPDFKRIRTELESRKAELDRLQQELQEKSRQLQMMMEKLREMEQRGGFPGGFPGGNPPFPGFPKKDIGREGPPKEGGPGREPGREGPPKEGGPKRDVGREGGREGGDVERRMDDLERKLDVLIRELVDLRRGMGKGGFGPMGPPNGGFNPFGPGKKKDGELAPPPQRQGGDGAFEGQQREGQQREGQQRDGQPREGRPVDRPREK